MYSKSQSDLDTPQYGRGHTEQLAPDVSDGGHLPHGGGVEPVVVPWTEVYHQLVQRPTTPPQLLTRGG